MRQHFEESMWRSTVKRRITTVITTAIISISLFTAPAFAASWHVVATFRGDSGPLGWITNETICATQKGILKISDPSGTYRCRIVGSNIYIDKKY
ncbi:hypothetical protein [Streptomyces sp. LN699]|uniref:hypothetical protein n=1 Tax=Streptomyces sp. LN699 TaxID=3112981 RepID=UPI00371A8448